MHLKLLQKESFQTAEETGEFIENKIANRIKKFSKNSEAVTNGHDKEIPKERYISLKERHC